MVAVDKVRRATFLLVLVRENMIDQDLWWIGDSSSCLQKLFSGDVPFILAWLVLWLLERSRSMGHRKRFRSALSLR
jgi:hypothetical protein